MCVVQFSGCNKKNNNTTKEYLTEISKWDSTRISNLKKETGWLNLVGLYWLKEGENTFGSDKTNDIIFPKDKADNFLGKIIKEDSIIIAVINQSSEVKHKGKPITKIKMFPDVSGNKTVLEHKSLKWFIIKRGNNYGIRLRDLEANLLRNFEGIDRFDVDESWKINAKFVEYDKPKVIQTPTIIGTIEESFSPGTIKFSVEKKEYTLQPTSAGKGLFIVFADLTSGKETYGAGRFLYVEEVDSRGNVVLDFNKAYNPPCAFTKYATCLLPTEENKLKIKITAGEKKYGKGH